MPSDRLHFTWDSDKNSENKKKHGVDFPEACSVFYDENAKLIDDPDHSDYEDRFIILGLSAKFRVLLVCHCYRGNENEIRSRASRK